ncbi:MAG: hypothetical protein U0835_06445 [Isosphaeraceae bacterium]
MSLRYRIIASVVWLVVGLGLGLLALWYLGSHPIPGASQQKRAEQLGQAVAYTISFGWAVLWIPWAYQKGQERRAAAARGSRPVRKGSGKRRR